MTRFCGLTLKLKLLQIMYFVDLCCYGASPFVNSKIKGCAIGLKNVQKLIILQNHLRMHVWWIKMIQSEIIISQKKTLKIELNEKIFSECTNQRVFMCYRQSVTGLVVVALQLRNWVLLNHSGGPSFPVAMIKHLLLEKLPFISKTFTLDYIQ